MTTIIPPGLPPYQLQPGCEYRLVDKFTPPTGPGFPVTPGTYLNRKGKKVYIIDNLQGKGGAYANHVFICSKTCKTYTAEGRWGMTDHVATVYDLIQRVMPAEVVTTEIVFEDVPVVADDSVHHLVAQDLNTSTEGGVG